MGVKPPGGNSMWDLHVSGVTVRTDLVNLKIHRLAQCRETTYKSGIIEAPDTAKTGSR